MKYPNQAQFHPLKYLKCLTDAIIRMGSEVYTQSKASDIKEGSAKVNGHEVIAKHIVVATNTPVNDLVTMHTKQFPYRTYVVAFTIPKANREPSLWWDTGDHESEWITMPYNYVRLQEYNDEDYLLICGGADHKTGQADKESTPEEDRYPILEDWARKRFPDVKEVVYRWSGQVMEPIDTMGYIGRNPGDKNVYIVTGDSGNGMTHGTIAGILLPDLIAGRSNPWEKLYDPARITFRATPDYLIENSNTFKQYGDLIAAGDVSKLEEIPAGEGSVISSGLKKYAVYKDEAGGIHAYSAFCTHLGCVVHWNGEEKSFDCPCHGSRFSREGKVMNGPALSNLPEVEVGRVEK
jgi:nitrite reductase/ring-hydroxylating ferredoxin subunit